MTNPPPYPADTRAKGWRFELDHERIDQSDTWSLAPAELRPWLLMLWMVAWKQTPCASLPEDDALIAARMGMPVKLYGKHRALLLRGWWRADDGRLYHPVMTERVEAMLGKREKDAGRTASRRAAISANKAVTHSGVTDVSRVTQSGVHREFDTKHQAPEEEKETTPTPSGAGRRSKNVHEFPPGFEALWSVYPRKVKKDFAAKAFAKRKPDAVLLDRMIAAVAAQRLSDQWQKDSGRFIPHLSTWLNDGQWMDEVSPRLDDPFVGTV